MPTTSQLIRKGRTAKAKKLSTPGLTSGKGRKKNVAAPQRRRRRQRPQEGPLAVRREEEVAMPRRAAAQIRPVEPDPVHRSRLVQQVINKVMLDGKKSKAEDIVYDALSIIAERTGKDAIEQ